MTSNRRISYLFFRVSPCDWVVSHCQDKPWKKALRGSFSSGPILISILKCLWDAKVLSNWIKIIAFKREGWTVATVECIIIIYRVKFSTIITKNHQLRNKTESLWWQIRNSAPKTRIAILWTASVNSYTKFIRFRRFNNIPKVSTMFTNVLQMANNGIFQSGVTCLNKFKLQNSEIVFLFFSAFLLFFPTPTTIRSKILS